MTITRMITVAAGVFAPGHLGELTWQVPFELADAVLEETRAREQRLRDLPSRTGIYFVLALGLFPRLGYGGVWQKLTAALDGSGLPSPSPKALRDLRRRVGAAPVKALFEVLAGPTARPSVPGVSFGRYRTVAFDGCTSIKVPDTPRNRSWRLEQEIWALLTLYQAIRRAMVTAAESVPGTDPDRASFTIALETAKETLTAADGVITDDAGLTGRIGRAVLDDILPPRRPRVSVRKVKSPLSRWNKADPYRPARSTTVTTMTVTLSKPEPARQPATRRERCLTSTPGP